MKLKVITGLVLTLFLIGMLISLAFNIQPVKAEPRTWTVDDDGPADFRNIQDAINAASPGDTIYVYGGKYGGAVVTKNNLRLIGENRSTTIMDGGYEDYPVVKLLRDPEAGIEASGVEVSEFTIQNGGEGILIMTSNNSIKGNILRNNKRHGIFLQWGPAYNLLDSNLIINNYQGIGMDGPGSINTLRNNVMINNSENFGIWGSFGELIQDIDISNTVNGKPIYYWVNQTNKQVPTDAGFVAAVYSTNITVKDVVLTNNTNGGVLFGHTINSTIKNVTVSNNWNGIMLIHSDYITITESTIINNKFAGIFQYDTWPFPCNNVFYHNNFISNTHQVNRGGGIWDNGYPSGGNYWSDYTGIDLYSGPYQNETGSDGIGDTPYLDLDRYPLMNPWTPTETSVRVKGKDYPVTIVSSTTLDKIVATTNTLHFKSSGPTGAEGYILLVFPMVNTTEIKVFIDGKKLTPPPFPVINTNTTHYFIYFEFTLSTHDIDIEFAPKVSVGGTIVPVNKLELLTPYISVVSVILVAITVVVKKRRLNHIKI